LRLAVAAVFQDFIRFELPLRDNVAPAGAPDDVVRAALESARSNEPGSTGHGCLPAGTTAGLTSRAANGSASALARALASVSAWRRRRAARRADAQLDVRGEAEIFDRLLAARRIAPHPDLASLLTVRHADRICVLEHGRVIELGTITS